MTTADKYRVHLKRGQMIKHEKKKAEHAGDLERVGRLTILAWRNTLLLMRHVHDVLWRPNSSPFKKGGTVGPPVDVDPLTGILKESERIIKK